MLWQGFGRFGAFGADSASEEVAVSFSGGALAYHSIDAGTTVYPLDQEVYDTDAFHSTVTNTSRLVVPAGVGLVRLSGQVGLDGTATPIIWKNGGVFLGSAIASTQDDLVNARTGPVSVTPGDYFEMTKSGGSSPDLTGGIWLSIEALDAATKYALVSKTSNQALTGGVSATLSWDNEVADTDGFHDNVTDNSRLTVPSGVSRVKLVANLASTGFVNTPYYVQITKNGSSVPGSPVFGSEFTGRMNLSSALLEVSPGDYFEVVALSNSGQTVATGNQTWFSIYEMPNYARALVRKVATQSVTSGVAVAAAFGSGSTVYDTDDIHDESTNNSRLTVPSGFTKAKLSYSLVTANAGGVPRVDIRKNGSSSATPGLPGSNVSAAGVNYLSGEGAWIDVEAGDYFELIFTPGANQTLPIDDRTWFAIELAA